MQSLQEAAHVAYMNELAAAERHMSAQEGPTSGQCCDCEWFRELRASEDAAALIRRPDFLGICLNNPDEPCVVDRSEVHDGEDCWEEARI